MKIKYLKLSVYLQIEIFHSEIEEIIAFKQFVFHKILNTSHLNERVD